MAERARRARISLYRLGEKTLSAAVHQSGDPTDMGSQQLMLIRDIYHATLQRAKERMRVAKMYRDRVLDLLRNIDRYIDSDETQQSRMVNEALLQINIGGDFQEPMK
jgi:hypothetical protein